MTFSQTLSCSPARPDLSAPPIGTLSPPVPRATLAEVLCRYRVGRILTAEPVAEGLLNRGYRVTAEAGTYFLKCYVDAATANRPKIVAHHRAMAALHALGLPVAPPLACAERAGTVAGYGGRLFALFPWTVGRHRHGTELSLPQCDALGTLLGHLHGALDDVCAPVSQPTGYRSADPRHSADLARDLLAHARAHHPYGELDALVEQRLTERLELLAEHAHRRPAPQTAPPTGWTHGDFHGLNLLYAGEPGSAPGGASVAAILDWDKLGPQPRAEEAVRAATLLFNDRTTGALDLVRVRHYSQAYRATGAATAEHLAAAAHRVWWERLNDFWMLQWRYQRADHRADPLYPASAGQLAWWCQEYEQVLDAFAN
ncbi:phosphotransferase [Kitasatospora aureofaciens]|uniref:phosphotransferase n=1 Tax=Kitasatospora aureofaciens TaxID=1894 RepID=UPI001C44ACA5|nr:phosphotransferase [Kitasatospora aureofaciens]MBV6698809.1 phosphotransferase [Kitasatospora aureofaciens]